MAGKRVSSGLVLVAVLCLLAFGQPARATDWWKRPTSGAIVGEFRPPERSYGSGHRGVDFAAAPGAPVYAMHTGIVLFAGSIAGIPIISVFAVTGDLRSTYQPIHPMVKTGDHVEQGQLLGHVAAKRIDHCLDICLHVGVRTDTQYFNPRLFWGGSLVLKSR